MSSLSSSKPRTAGYPSWKWEETREGKMKVRSRVNIILSIGFLVLEVDAVGNWYFLFTRKKKSQQRRAVRDEDLEDMKFE